MPSWSAAAGGGDGGSGTPSRFRRRRLPRGRRSVVDMVLFFGGEGETRSDDGQYRTIGIGLSGMHNDVRLRNGAAMRLADLPGLELLEILPDEHADLRRLMGYLMTSSKMIIRQRSSEGMHPPGPVQWNVLLI